MIDCDRFDKIQVASLLDEASADHRRQAAAHTRSCAVCRAAAAGDRRLARTLARHRGSATDGLERARRRLARTLRERRVFCRRIDGPFGAVYLGATARGLCRVSFRSSEGEFLRELERADFLPDFEPARLDREARQVDAYLAGRLRRFRLPLDLRPVTPFQERVLRATLRVPFGRVASYGDIARRIGQPRATRAVGGALGRNPIAIVVPCHRVVAAGGRIGGYTGGLRIKRALMEIEGIGLAKETA
jgi:methylated-DNA-[protein]-cysteine S-methyltransferase